MSEQLCTLSLQSLRDQPLTTELAQLQTSSFEEGSSDLSFEEPSFTAQLCLYLGLGEASSLGGAQLRTAELQGGVLSRASPMHSLTLTSLSLPQLCGSSFAWPLERELAACQLSRNNYFAKITNFTRNFLKMSFFPGNLESAKSLKNNSQGIIFVVISCRRVPSLQTKLLIPQNSWGSVVGGWQECRVINCAKEFSANYFFWELRKFCVTQHGKV